MLFSRLWISGMRIDLQDCPFQVGVKTLLNPKQMKITVSALPIKKVLKDLSELLEVPIEEDAGELSLELPSDVGEGWIRGTGFASGIGIISYHCTFFEDTEIHFVKHETHPLKFIFCSEGRVQHSFQKEEEQHTIHAYQNIIVSSWDNNGHVLYFKANEPTKVFSLEVIRKKLNQRESFDYKDLDEPLRRVFLDEDAGTRFFYQGNYSILAANIVEDIEKKLYSGFLRSIYLEGKAFEMMVLQIQQYQDDQREDTIPQMLRRSDVEKVKRAVDLVHSDLSQNYSVDYLAKEVGTNVNKLQEGFKYMFNLTVNKYMQQAKLEAAKELLATTEYNISQVVDLIGLNNRSYFSKVFRERYGVKPKYFLKSRLEEKKKRK